MVGTHARAHAHTRTGVAPSAFCDLGLPLGGVASPEHHSLLVCFILSVLLTAQVHSNVKVSLWCHGHCPHAHGNSGRRTTRATPGGWEQWGLAHAAQPERGGGWVAKTVKRPAQPPAHPPVRHLLGPRQCGNDTTRNGGRSGRRNALTRRSRREGKNGGLSGAP